MRLYLVQHGEACAKEVDPERPLSDQGKHDIDQLAALMLDTGNRVGRVIHSGKRRAQQTAERLARAMAPDVELETSGLINPNDDPAAFDWHSESLDRDTLIVGHLPFMAKLVSQLMFNDKDRHVVSYRPGSMVCLETDQGIWKINWMIRPELLNRSNNQ
ncbi:MAG: phosphohistidine phosphatase SixA [Gammaproteobacteria bacterium]